jgi:hypothetical protein
MNPPRLFRQNLALVLAVIGAPFSFSASAEPTVDEIVNHYVKAIGGTEKLKQLQTLVIRGEYREGDHVLPGATMAKMRPYYKLVGDPAKPVTDFAEGYDGSAWEYYQDPGIVVRIVGKAAAATRHGLAVDGPLSDYRAKGSTVTLQGTEKIDGRPAFCLRVRMADGFEENEFVDAETWLWIASRKVASVHAFGREIATETRFSDYRPIDGILFSFSSKEVEIATGKVLNEFRTTSITVNEKLDPAVFSPPTFTPGPLQKLLADLYGERTDVNAVLWSYHEFRRAHPEIETDEGMQAIGYQTLKMGDHPAAVALLEANAKEHPKSSDAFFGLGRAYREQKEFAKARAQFEMALKVDPDNKRARQALSELPASGS